MAHIWLRRWIKYDCFMKKNVILFLELESGKEREISHKGNIIFVFVWAILNNISHNNENFSAVQPNFNE